MQRPHYKKALLIQELFFEDRKALLPLPAVPYDESRLRRCTNSYAKFTLNDGKHTYSTAPRYANSEVFVRLTAHDVIVLDESYREAIRHPASTVKRTRNPWTGCHIWPNWPADLRPKIHRYLSHAP